MAGSRGIGVTFLLIPIPQACPALERSRAAKNAAGMAAFSIASISPNPEPKYIFSAVRTAMRRSPGPKWCSPAYKSRYKPGSTGVGW